MQLNKTAEDRQYLTVLADGKIHKTVAEGTEGAVVRPYEDKDGNQQSKSELVFDGVSGLITGLSFEDGEFGTSLQVEIDNEGILSLGTSSSFGEDFMKKLPSVDLTKEVRIAPYSFEAAGKSKKGVSIYQGDTKLGSYYYNAETKEAINGIPSPEGDTGKYSTDDWKLYFLQVRKFLVGQVNALIAAKFPEVDL